MMALDATGFRAAARGEHPLIGTCQMLPGALVAGILGQAGFPWVLVDLQHGATEIGDLLHTLIALEHFGVAALVRTRSDQPDEIMRVLDLGALGVVVPMVDTAAQAKAIVAATRYPPAGSRSLGPLRGRYGRVAEQIAPLCFVMVETAKAIVNLAEIASTDGLDGILLGPADMTLALGGVPGGPPEQPLLDVAGKIAAACRERDRIAGVFAGDAAATGLYSRLGMRLVCLGSDKTGLMQAMKHNLDLVRKP